MFAAFPVFGVGFGTFQFVSPSFLVGAAPDSTFSHNQYLNVLAEQGIVGAVIVAALVVMGIVAIIRSGSPADDRDPGHGRRVPRRLASSSTPPPSSRAPASSGSCWR